jgi:hypothetical protein
VKPQPVAPLRFEPPFVTIAKQLIAAGRPIPIPLARAIDNDYAPLSLSTREDWPAWAALNGYSPEQIELLGKCIATLVRWPNYLEAIASDLAVRIDYDGKPTEPVSQQQALTAALMLHRREMHKAHPRPLELSGR